LNSKGKYYGTKYRSSGSKVWNPPSSQRFNKSGKVTLIQVLKFQGQAITFPLMNSVIRESTCYPLKRAVVKGD
jgi:hypothetical protein